MTAMAEKQEIIETPQFSVAAYNEFAAQMQELREHNKSVFFNYDDPKGNKEARSHVYKLRQTKSAIDKVRKSAGDEARKTLKDINDQGNALVAEVEGMIDLHDRHIKAVEEKEKARVADIRTRIDGIKIFVNCKGDASHDLRENLQFLESMKIDTSFAEFMAEATTALEDAVAATREELAAAEKREAEAAELERLRKEATEREQKERDERIARDAAEKARVEAEEKARAEKEAADRRERELNERAEYAEREKSEAAARAEREKVEAVEAERRRQEQESAAKAAEEAKREADKKHQIKIHGEIIAALAVHGVAEDAAKAIIIAIRNGDVPHVKIIY